MGIELVRGDRKSLIPIIDRWSWEIALPRRKAARENGDKLSEKPESQGIMHPDYKSKW